MGHTFVLPERDSVVLVAYGPDGRVVVAEEGRAEQLQRWSRGQELHCPNCRGVVHVRGGPDKQIHLHFAHQKGECAWSTESESVRHVHGKLVLAQWLREQFPQATVTLEERLPGPNRIADIFISHSDGQHWAVEFQCAPLDIEEWRHRHEAYRNAGIIDIWIVGENRKEKQEAFIEAIAALAHEVLFLDPLTNPPRAWLRWPVTRTQAQEWQQDHLAQQLLDGRVGRQGYSATLPATLPELHCDEQGRLVHPRRVALEARTQLLQTMSRATVVDASLLAAYLRLYTDEETLRSVVFPLVNAYLLDPELLRRYNYGRGQLSPSEQARIDKARAWLARLAQHGFTPVQLQTLQQSLPFAGPYAALAGYFETLLSLA